MKIWAALPGLGGISDRLREYPNGYT